MDPLEARLRDGLDRLGLALHADQIGQIMGYLSLLQKWNAVYNLTAVRAPEAMLTQHLLDALAVLPPLRRQYPQASSLLDVGSGAGLPGVLLAIAWPALQVTCLDAVAKKSAFVQQVASQLGLSNLHARHGRVEALPGRSGQTWDVICARAFSSLDALVRGSCAALAPGGVWMAMKGRLPEDEMKSLPAGVEVFHVEQLQVPFLSAERCLVWLRRAPS